MTEEVIRHFFLNHRNTHWRKRFIAQQHLILEKGTNLTEFSPVSPASMLSSGFNIFAPRKDLLRAQRVLLLSLTQPMPQSPELQPGTEQYR
jgi:hypothetical protein